MHLDIAIPYVADSFDLKISFVQNANRLPLEMFVFLFLILMKHMK